MSESRESRMVTLRRKPDGTPAVWCDPEIADLVSALNAGGVPTVASCSGHGERPGNIALADGRELIIAKDYAEARAIEACWNTRPALLQAEVESLRAEVELLTFEMGCLQQQYDERTAYMIVHRGAWLACSDAVRSAYSDEHHRAERLEKTLGAYKAAVYAWLGVFVLALVVAYIAGFDRGLREAQPFIGWTGSYPELHAKIDALLRDQEEGHD